MIDLVSASSCLRVQKNAPATVLIAYGVCGYSKRCRYRWRGCCVRGFKKMHPQQSWLPVVFAGAQKGVDVGGDGAVFAGSKKCTRNSTDCLRCLRVQKNAPAMVLNVVILSVAKDLLPVNPKTMLPTSSLRVGLCPTWQSLLRSMSCWAAQSISSLVGFEGILRYTRNDSP